MLTIVVADDRIVTAPPHGSTAPAPAQLKFYRSYPWVGNTAFVIFRSIVQTIFLKNMMGFLGTIISWHL
jgi:hypothetical protein